MKSFHLSDKQSNLCFHFRTNIKPVLLFAAVLCSLSSFFQLNAGEKDEALLNEYVQAKGNGIIVFDHSNIRLYWPMCSVSADNRSFQVPLNNVSDKVQESNPLKIQLANVNESQDCTIDVITESSDFEFSVVNSDSNILSKSIIKERFIDYFISSASFHLENTQDLSFFLRFRSGTAKQFSIKKIVISFAKNKNSSFVLSPGTLHLNDFEILDSTVQKESSGTDTLSVSGTRTKMFSKYKIFVDENTIKYSVTIKNEGQQPTNIYLGFVPYSKGGDTISNRNNPYDKQNTVLEVLIFDNKSVIVDSYPKWKKGCFLVRNAKKDLSDFPNFSFIESEIDDVVKLDANQAKIIFKTPIADNSVRKGDLVRIQSGYGSTYLYTSKKLLEPNESFTFTGEIKKNVNHLLFSSSAFCRGTYYVVPLILSYSVSPTVENVIRISDYTLSY